MIEISEKNIHFEGTRLDILVDVIYLFDWLLKLQPEIINGVVAGYTERLSKSIDTCNSIILRLLIEMVEEYNERKEQP